MNTKTVKLWSTPCRLNLTLTHNATLALFELCIKSSSRVKCPNPFFVSNKTTNFPRIVIAFYFHAHIYTREFYWKNILKFTVYQKRPKIYVSTIVVSWPFFFSSFCQAVMSPLTCIYDREYPPTPFLLPHSLAVISPSKLNLEINLCSFGWWSPNDAGWMVMGEVKDDGGREI